MKKRADKGTVNHLVVSIRDLERLVDGLAVLKRVNGKVYRLRRVSC